MDRVYLHGPPPRPLESSSDYSDSTGLIDEYQFGVVPVILGKGRKLLDDLDGPRQLSLAGEPEVSFRNRVTAIPRRTLLGSSCRDLNHRSSGRKSMSRRSKLSTWR